MVRFHEKIVKARMLNVTCSRLCATQNYMAIVADSLVEQQKHHDSNLSVNTHLFGRCFCFAVSIRETSTFRRLLLFTHMLRRSQANTNECMQMIHLKTKYGMHIRRFVLLSRICEKYIHSIHIQSTMSHTNSHTLLADQRRRWATGERWCHACKVSTWYYSHVWLYHNIRSVRFQCQTR